MGSAGWHVRLFKLMFSLLVFLLWICINDFVFVSKKLITLSVFFVGFSLQTMLLERPRVVSEQVGHAWDLPDNKFGAAYARVMGPRNFSPFRP